MASLRDAFDDMLDDVYPPVVLGGVEYSYSLSWYKVDEIAYQLAYDEWLDAEIEDGTFKEEVRDAEWEESADEFLL